MKTKAMCILIAILFVSACSGAIGTNMPDFTTPTGDQSGGKVATMVAETLTAMAVNVNTSAPTATSTPEPVTVLPQTLYYLAVDSTGIVQLFRLDRDGVTIKKVTSEQYDVYDFDVSSAHGGKIVFDTGGQLILCDPDGANRMVIDNIQPNSHQYYVAYPHWSPDGKIIAYLSGMQVHFYDLVSKTSTLALGNDGVDYISIGDFSPDGKDLIVGTTNNKAIYNISTATISFLKFPEFSKQTFKFSPVTWSKDSRYVYAADWMNGGSGEGLRLSGLWRFDTDGIGLQLIAGITVGAPSNPSFISTPFQEPDGSLVYLYSPPAPQSPKPQLSLVHSDADGVTNRTVLRPETFKLDNSGLWMPDGKGFIILQVDDFAFSSMLLVPVDPSLPVITLMNDARSVVGWQPLRWGP